MDIPSPALLKAFDAKYAEWKAMLVERKAALNDASADTFGLFVMLLDAALENAPPEYLDQMQQFLREHPKYAPVKH